MRLSDKWLRRPFAHRGLHARDRDIIENTRSAFIAAIDKGYGIETDLRLARCGTVMVFHDRQLQRLTQEQGRVDEHPAHALQAVSFRRTSDHMMTLTELLALVAGRVPLLLELKSGWDGNPSLSDNVIDQIGDYDGPVALMSFDPALIIRIKQKAPEMIRGIVAESDISAYKKSSISSWQRLQMQPLIALLRTRPDFIAYNIDDLPVTIPALARRLLSIPLLTWTVRTPEQRRRAQKYADNIIFEAFLP